jgi:hypothetical protein
MRCKYYEHAEIVYTHPWRNEPALAQFRAVVGYQDGRPVTQIVFFGKDLNPDLADNGPPESLANFLFAPVPASGETLLNQYAFMSNANFGVTHNVIDNDFCY